MLYRPLEELVGTFAPLLFADSTSREKACLKVLQGFKLSDGKKEREDNTSSQSVDDSYRGQLSGGGQLVQSHQLIGGQREEMWEGLSGDSDIENEFETILAAGQVAEMLSPDTPLSQEMSDPDMMSTPSPPAHVPSALENR